MRAISGGTELIPKLEDDQDITTMQSEPDSERSDLAKKVSHMSYLISISPMAKFPSNFLTEPKPIAQT